MKTVKQTFIICATAAASLAFPAVAFAKKFQDMSAAEKLKVTGHEGIMATLSNIALISGILIFSFLFFRRWKIPRMGYFLATVVILLSRFRMPDDLFWKTGAVTAGLFSLIMFASAYKRIDFDTKKEPMYFLFNAFTLLVIAFSMEFFTMSLACASLFASLFFIVTLKPVPRGKFTQFDADGKIMEVLEHKTHRRL
jgi:hypothetical protein